MRILALLLCLAATGAMSQTAASKRKAGNPLDHLPGNIEILTHFGERADFSPDNQRIAFMNKSFGDAFVIDLKTRIIRCLTCNVPGAAFLRVMHLSNGDYILIGPDHFEDIRTSRTRDNELWYLSRAPGSKPVKMGQRMSEGMAISKTSMKVAFSVLPPQDPSLGQGSRLEVAEVAIGADGGAKLINKKTVHRSPDAKCRLEAQDFYDNDSKLTFTCYEPNDLGSAMKLDLATGEAVNLSKLPGSYNEAEGIIPGGVYTLVEADRQCETLGGKRGSGNIDIWKLKMDGSGKEFERLTFFNDYEGGKASNPVVSTDGRFVAFQYARTTDPAGVGYGILLYKFRR
jgi:Tol biopolymer transport system component